MYYNYVQPKTVSFHTQNHTINTSTLFWCSCDCTSWEISYNKRTRRTTLSNLFWKETLRVSDSSSVHHQEFFTVHIAMVYVIQFFWQLASKLSEKLILEGNSIRFGQFLCPSSGVFHCTHSNGICHTVFLTAWKLSEKLYDIYHCCVCVCV